MFVRGGLPPSICSQIEKCLNLTTDKLELELTNGGGIQKIGGEEGHLCGAGHKTVLGEGFGDRISLFFKLKRFS